MSKQIPNIFETPLFHALILIVNTLLLWLIIDGKGGILIIFPIIAIIASSIGLIMALIKETGECP